VIAPFLLGRRSSAAPTSTPAIATRPPPCSSPSIKAISMSSSSCSTKARTSTSPTRSTRCGRSISRCRTPEITAAIEKKVASLPPDSSAVTVAPEVLQTYVGSYRNEASGATFTVALMSGELLITPPGGQPLPMVATAITAFKLPDAPGVVIAFAGRGGMIERMSVTQGAGAAQWYERAAAGSTPPQARRHRAPRHQAPWPRHPRCAYRGEALAVFPRRQRVRQR
jgi:hypothetical protein